RLAHGVVEVEHDLFAVAAAGHADHVVDLHLAAGADAEIALDAGVRLTAIAGWLRSGASAARRGNRLVRRPCRSAVSQNSDCGSCATSLGGWSVSNSSTTMRRAVLARWVCVLTFMPGVGVRMQLAASTRSPSISTMQTRQLPSGR